MKTVGQGGGSASRVTPKVERRKKSQARLQQVLARRNGEAAGGGRREPSSKKKKQTREQKAERGKLKWRPKGGETKKANQKEQTAGGKNTEGNKD